MTIIIIIIIIINIIDVAFCCIILLAWNEQPKITINKWANIK